MLSNLYPVMNLTTFSGPRAVFLYDLFTHKEIDICGHIYYPLTKCITKKISRTVLPFPSLIMALIARTRLKFSSGLTMVQRDYLISAQIMTRSKAHITGPGISQIPRDNVKEEGGDMEEEIDRFKSAPEGLAQPSSQAQARGPNCIDHLIAWVEQMYGILQSYVQHTTDQFTYIEGQITAISSQINDMMMEQQRQQQDGSESESEQFQPLWPFQSKRGRNLRGELHSLRGSIALHFIDIGLFWWWFSSLLWFQQSTFFYLYSFYDSWIFTLLSFKALKYFSLKTSFYLQYFVCLLALQLFKYFQIIYALSLVLHTYALVGSCILDANTVVFCIGYVLDMQLSLALVLIAMCVWKIIYQLNFHCSHSLMTILV